MRERRKVGRAILKETKNVKTVYSQVGGIEGVHRLRNLEFLAGVDDPVTVHRENGCAFMVDVRRCYFSPRLSTERLRVATLVRPGERVLNMFAGVGPFSIPIAKRVRARVTSCEVNDVACEYHRQNDSLNKVEGLVKVVNADANELPRISKSRFDRILMPHPSQSDRFLQVALRMAKRRAAIHYYRHVLGRNEEEASEALREELAESLPKRIVRSVRKVREVGPRWLELVAELKLGD